MFVGPQPEPEQPVSEEVKELAKWLAAEHSTVGRQPGEIDASTVDLVRMAEDQGHKIERCECGGPKVRSLHREKSSLCLRCWRSTGRPCVVTTDEPQPFKLPFTMKLEDRLARYYPRMRMCVCGASLAGKRQGSQYCSPRCRMAGMRARRVAAKAA